MPGATVELGFLGSVLQVELPHCTDEQQLTECDPKSHVNSVFLSVSNTTNASLLDPSIVVPVLTPICASL